mgnify:CR=1 FL=1
MVASRVSRGRGPRWESVPAAVGEAVFFPSFRLRYAYTQNRRVGRARRAAHLLEADSSFDHLDRYPPAHHAVSACGAIFLQGGNPTTAELTTF